MTPTSGAPPPDFFHLQSLGAGGNINSHTLMHPNPHNFSGPGSGGNGTMWRSATNAGGLMHGRTSL